MRRPVAVIAALVLVGAAAAGAFVLATRRIRWNDARTMPPPLELAVRSYAKGDAAGALAFVRQLLKRYRAPAWEGRARILAAAHLAREGRDRGILDVLPSDFPPDDPLATLASLLRARGWLARGDPARAARLAGSVSAYPEFPSAGEARLLRARALEAGGGWREALGALDASGTPADELAAARLAARHGDLEGARRRLAAELLRASAEVDLDRAREVTEELFPDAARRLSEAERPRLAQRARRFLDDGHAESAVELLRLVRPAGAPSAATGSEALIEAEALLKLGNVAEMPPLLFRARAAGAAFEDGARYLEARRAAVTGNLSAYRAGLEALARRGEATWRERALVDLARAGEGAPSARTLEAYRRYRLAAGSHADPLALLREGWAAYDLGKNAEAAAAFVRAEERVDAPDGVKVTAMYWKARLAEAAGRNAEARAGYAVVADTFSNHYYGSLAAKRLGRPNPKAAAGAPPPTEPSALGSAGRWLAAARELVSVGLWDEAAPCYRTALRRSAAAAPSIALEATLAARDAAAASDAVGIAQDAAGDRDRRRADDLPRELWRLLYPAPFADELARAAHQAGLDPPLVAAVALQESAFNPLAVSSAGARGLLQVMPAVAAELARPAGLAKFTPADLFDPATNLRLGCAHLRAYVDRFRSIPRALAGYNGGPSRVERWTLTAGRDDDERFVERIPIPETRLYVKRVLAGARMYAIAWPDGLGAR